jgi:hypothetical protein
MAKPKPQPTNGPYSWGNGPKPHGVIKRLIKKLQGK